MAPRTLCTRLKLQLRRTNSVYEVIILTSRIDLNVNCSGAGHLASYTYAGERAYSRRPHIYLYDDPLKSDIQLLSYYINKFKQDKAMEAPPTESKKGNSIVSWYKIYKFGPITTNFVCKNFGSLAA